jgi:modified peptide precursor CbpA
LAYRNTVRIRGGPAAVIGEVLHAGRRPVTAGANPGGKTVKSRRPESQKTCLTEKTESDGKGFRRTPVVRRNPFFISTQPERRRQMKKKSAVKSVIAYRKSCKAKGTGLSHYILMDRKAK